MRPIVLHSIYALTCLFGTTVLHASRVAPISSEQVDRLCGTGIAGSLHSLRGNDLLLDNNSQSAASTTNVSQVIVCRINLFRYGSKLGVQRVVVAPQPLPTGIAGALSNANSSSATSTLVVTGQAIDLLPPSGAPQNKDFFQKWSEQVDAQRNAATVLVNSLAARKSNVALRLGCYQDVANAYPMVLLSVEERNGLIARLSKKFCLGTSATSAWENKDTQAVLAVIQNAAELGTHLLEAEDTKAYASWVQGPAKTALFAALITITNTTLTDTKALLDQTAIDAYNASVLRSREWDQRAAMTLAATDAWNQTIALHCGIEFFGRNESHTVTLTTTDFVQPTPTPSFTFTNTCLPSLTVSTGLAFSTVRNSTFAFEPGPGTATNATTTQVIGYATDNRITPLFVGQLNYAYLPHERAVQLHISGGAGVGTSSGGTSGDFFLGNAISFAHRAIFITPAFQLTSRTRLRDGYKLGDLMGALTSVPTISGWQSGFMLTVTFAVLH